MASTLTIDLRHVARGLGTPLRQVQAVVELLDEGNTVPFITRYRKDQTGGLDEEQIRQIQARLTKMRLLADRKQTILRSIEAQGKLTEELAKQILAAGTTKRLEDLYLPFKPKKQTLATLARSRGLEPLAQEILAGDAACADLDARAREFVNPDRQVPTAADALLGAGHILAEQFSERADLRQSLREILQRTGKFVTTQAAPEPKDEACGELSRAGRGTKGEGGRRKAEGGGTSTSSVESRKAEGGGVQSEGRATSDERRGAPTQDSAEKVEQVETIAAESTGEAATSQASRIEVAPEAMEVSVQPDAVAAVGQQLVLFAEEVVPSRSAQIAPSPSEMPAESPADETVEPLPEQVSPGPTEPSAALPLPSVPATDQPPAEPLQLPTTPAAAAEPPRAPALPTVAKAAKDRSEKSNKKELKKKRLEEKRVKAFRDYFDYREEIKKTPPHRTLAINRGERAKVLRVRIEADMQAMHQALEELLVPPGHPHADYLRGCARDALTRLILPSLEREIRRELTDRAEAHAVGVFAKNLRNLLLQPPVRERRLLAVDPGYKSGCKLAALDQFGNMLEHAVIYLVGKPERRIQAREKVIDLVTRLELSLVAVGNGTACREAEKFFGELLDADLKGRGVAYVIVNEAGASVYSTSRIGREEFPHYDASLRGAISIGRRLQDPLSELVKIDPANIGVGLYQHDVKAKHLRTSLDEVVESCVNYVGVDVNTASPALLRYVSGLNQLTARRVYEYRREHGPFSSREQLREVPGFGEATFVQAAGFLKIAGGSNPLDATWIHPESYETANRVLAKLAATTADLMDNPAAAALAQRVAQADRAALAQELAVGTHTLHDILAQFARPGRDPREDLPAPVFKQGVLKLEDLTPGMELTGTVLNVVDFGAFVDIGMHDSGLVHVSHLADRYIRDPHEVVAVGDIVKVWVLEVDKERRRVSLTMVRPGSERPRHPPHADKPSGERGGRPAEGAAASAGSGAPRGPRPPRPAQDRPPRPPRSKSPPPRRGPPPKPRQQPPKPRPKPLIPITEAMKKGKEPMRTFGDLLQFYEQKPKPQDDNQPRAQPAAAPAAPVPTPDVPVSAPVAAVPATDAAPADIGPLPSPEGVAPADDPTAATAPDEGQGP